MEDFPPSSFSEIERRLADWKAESCEWRQGDCVLQACDFFWQIDPRFPLTDESKEATSEDSVAAQEFPGAVVLTQTCDIVRSWESKPFLEVAPLVEVEPASLEAIRKGRQPGYLFVPALIGDRLVGDLSRTMCVEKSVVAAWHRIPGWERDEDGQKLARDIVRRLERFAFPDDIVAMYRRWEGRIKDKHGRNTAEGKLLDALSEIRVEVSPNWGGRDLEITFLLILPEDRQGLEAQMDAQIPAWRDMLMKPTRVKSVSFVVERLSTLTAIRYLASARMDFDHLSTVRSA